MSDHKFKSPGSQLSKKQKHKELYKTSPNWQKIYKKQCLSRLNESRNESRSRLIDRFRNININSSTDWESHTKCMVDEVMQSVWENQFGALTPHDNSDITDFMEQIRQELLNEESSYWEDLMEWHKEEETDWLISNRESVVCFFCQKSPFIVNCIPPKTQLSCLRCGFDLLVPFSFALAYLRERVDSIFAKHSQFCANTSMKFCLINDCSNIDDNNIMVFCDDCAANDLIFKGFKSTDSKF